MPKNTFFNLEREKRERIEKAAIEEFYNNKFSESSINNIVKKSSISKGSFYQYFEDKYDVYKYIMDLIVKEKLIYLNPILKKESELNFYDFLRELYVQGYMFALNNPKYYKISCELLKNPELKVRIYGEYKDLNMNYMKSFILKGIKDGSINKNIDVELGALMIKSFGEAFSEYIIENKYDKKEVLQQINKLINMLKCGLKDS